MGILKRSIYTFADHSYGKIYNSMVQAFIIYTKQLFNNLCNVLQFVNMTCSLRFSILFKVYNILYRLLHTLILCFYFVLIIFWLSVFNVNINAYKNMHISYIYKHTHTHTNIYMCCVYTRIYDDIWIVNKHQRKFKLKFLTTKVFPPKYALKTKYVHILI